MDNEDNRRIGIMGGSFDPIHVAHLLVAESAREQLGLHEVRFLPAAQSPLKASLPAVSDKQRVEMLQLALNGNSSFVVDDRELRRGGKSYTVDTLRELTAELPDDELVFIMGADSLAGFDQWKSPGEICELAFVAVLERGGNASVDLGMLERYLPESEKANAATHLVKMPQLEISSSDLRRRVAEGRTTRYQLPPAVAAYIDSEKLYVG